MLGSSLRGTARHWAEALAKHEPRLPAASLYVGRSIADAKFVAAHLRAPLYVASAGVGLVHSDDMVAPYDLTPANKDSGLQVALSTHESTAADWWQAICGRGLAGLLQENPSAVLLAALPATYVQMLAPDLARCTHHELRRVRLFTSRAGAASLPGVLSATVMPYDERLEAVRQYAGTRADFPQRALRHFVERLSGHELDQRAGLELVRQALAKYCVPRTIARTRASDEQVQQLIRTKWKATGGRSSVLLRYLRDEALVACEQARFGKLWREVRDQLSASERR
ncbi:hypothetical protein GCM10028813_09360 [Ramlibacter alkalitolerans]